ncbi:MAG TPA: hypothetical protein DCR24_06115, partial [Bacillus bacterium]|nr:hypothetical protein [Bacillus sp. (in: firmicutes)]
SWLSDISESQLELMKALYNFIEQEKTSNLSGAAHSWHQFLFHNGIIPPSDNGRGRIIQFQLHGKDFDRHEISEALNGFFPDDIIIWIKDSYGLLVEERKEISETLDELESISITFESDFFMKVSFFAGKFQNINEKFPAFFDVERKLFHQAENLATRMKVYTFERIFPILIASSMPQDITHILQASVLEAFMDDRELMTTIKVFLESNSNASLAAKKLYVHRNTLQYRMDKFMEKTGINLKDFDSAVMVYLACLYADLR